MCPVCCRCRADSFGWRHRPHDRRLHAAPSVTSQFNFHHIWSSSIRQRNCRCCIVIRLIFCSRNMVEDVAGSLSSNSSGARAGAELPACRPASPKLPSSCKYCGADSSVFVFDDSSGQLTCTECGSQLGGIGRIDFSVTGETRLCAAALLRFPQHKTVTSTQV